MFDRIIALYYFNNRSLTELAVQTGGTFMQFPNVQGITDTDTFIHSSLPKFANSEDLYALFATYNKFEVFPTPHRQGLSIVIKDGYDSFSGLPILGMAALAHGDLELATLICD